MPEMTRHEKLLAEAETLLAQSERETSRLRHVVELLRDTLREPGSTFKAPDQDVRHFSDLSSPKAAEIILRAFKRPLHIMEIIKAMEGRGYDIGDPKKMRSTLYANMLRQDRKFRRTGPGTFALLDTGRDQLALTQ